MFRSTAYDVASYNQGGKTLTRTFYADLNSPRYADHALWADDGIPVCVYGRVSGHRCSFVDYHTGERGNVIVEHAVTTGGDSGGPWFWNYTAYGIHAGRAYTDGPSRFTGIGYNPWGANWRVWTR